jgi:hypothetical protein
VTVEAAQHFSYYNSQVTVDAAGIPVRCYVLPAGVLHLLGKSYLHYALLPGQAVPDWRGLMQQQPPRHSSSPAAGKAEFALYTFSKHMAYAPKQAINSQVCGAMITTCYVTAALLPGRRNSASSRARTLAA